MATEVFIGATIIYHNNALSSSTTAVSTDHSVEMLDGTTLGNDTRINVGGLKVSSIGIDGLTDYTNNDADLFADIGIEDKPLTIQTSGGKAIFMPVLFGEYNTGGSVGELNKFTISAGSRGALASGTVLMAITSVNATGSSTAVLMGATSSTQKLRAALHCTSFTGTSVAVIIESDDNAGFTSPTTVATFTTLTATGSQWIEVSGPITDTYLRVKYTVTSATASITVSAAIN